MASKTQKTVLLQEERKILEDVIARHISEKREVLQAKIVLLADEGKENQEIAKKLGLTQDVVGK